MYYDYEDFNDLNNNDISATRLWTSKFWTTYLPDDFTFTNWLVCMAGHFLFASLADSTMRQEVGKQRDSDLERIQLIKCFTKAQGEVFPFIFWFLSPNFSSLFAIHLLSCSYFLIISWKKKGLYKSGAILILCFFSQKKEKELKEVSSLGCNNEQKLHIITLMFFACRAGLFWYLTAFM